MALTYVGTCPHCEAEKSAFTFVQEVVHRLDPHSHTNRFTLVFKCPSCFEVIGVVLDSTSGTDSFVRDRHGTLEDHVGHLTNYRIAEVYPRRTSVGAPEHVSPSVARVFKQAVDNEKRKHTDAAGAMYRKCLDLATKELDVSLAGRKLAARIDALHEKGLLTDGLRDWAHAIRLDGNDASHEADELTTDELQQLGSFTNLFLLYTFTLPKQVELRKADKG